MLSVVYMNLEQIRFFITVVDTGSLSKAAEVLHKTQPAISIALKKLEESLGVPLLSRSKYRLELTPEGEKLLRHFRIMHRQQSILRSYASHLAAGIEKEVSIAYDVSTAADELFNVIKEVKSEFPMTELHVSGKERLGALNSLLKGEVDIAISPWLPTFLSFGDFETTVFSDMRLIDVLHRDLVDFDTSQGITKTRLSHIPQIMPKSFELDVDSDTVFFSDGISIIKTDDLFSQKALLCAGAGWGAIPEHLVEQELKSGILKKIVIEDLGGNAFVEVHVVRMATSSAGPVASRIWQLLHK